MAYFECLVGGGGNDATITVNYGSDFYNKTITCSNGVDTYTQTTTSSGTTEFDIDTEGTWTITCNGETTAVDVIFNYVTTIAYTKTVTVYSAALDTVSFTDIDGAKTVITDSDGQGSVSITYNPNDIITFTSSVAKDPNDLTQAYSKAITINHSTTEIYVMPSSDKVLYWYGYKNSNFTLSARVDISSQYVPTPAIYQTNYVQMTAYNDQRCCIGCTNAVTGVTTAAYTIISDVTNNSTGYQDFEVASNYNPRSGAYISLGYTAPLRVLTCTTNGSPSTGWIRLHESVGTAQTATAKVYAIWWN